MRRRSLGLRLGLAATVLATPTLVAPAAGATEDGTAPAALQIEEMDVSAYPDVTLVVSVPPELVGTDLTQGFSLFEDGDSRTITATHVPTDGLQVVLVVDTSASMEGEPIAAAEEAALGFLDGMPSGVEVAVVTFASGSDVVSPPSPDLEQARTAITALRTGGETALYDGLSAATRVFADTGGRRALVLLSDGGDTVSETSLETALIDLVASGASFHAIELQSPEVDSAALTRLAVAAAGVVVPADEPAALHALFTEIAGKIVNRYELTYRAEGRGTTTLLVAASSDGVVAAVRHEVRFPDPPQLTSPTREPGSAPTATPATIPSSPPGGTPVALAFWQKPVALWIGGLAIFIALAALAMAGRHEPRVPDEELGVDGDLPAQAPRNGLVAGIAERAMLVAERAVRHRSTDNSLAERLERAGLHLRVGEFIVLWMAATLLVTAVAMAFAGLIAGMMAAGLTGLAASSWLTQRGSNRQAAFADQLPDVLQLISGSVRAGFGLMQAIEVVGQEVASPAGEEFRRVRVETQLGRDTNEALHAMAERVGSEDFKWIVEAVEIHREVGGDFADILDSVTGTVRTRNRIRRRIHALSAEGRVTGIILSLLPFALALVIILINPGYLAELVTTTAGRILIVAGLALMATGGLWMRRITTTEY
jgi:tight adherence protein B